MGADRNSTRRPAVKGRSTADIVRAGAITVYLTAYRSGGRHTSGKRAAGRAAVARVFAGVGKRQVGEVEKAALKIIRAANWMNKHPDAIPSAHLFTRLPGLR